MFSKKVKKTTDLHQSMYCYLLFTKIIVQVDQNKKFLNPDLKYLSDFRFQKKCRILSDSESVTSLRSTAISWTSLNLPPVDPVFTTPCLKKLCKLIFCQNFVKFRPIAEIFGTKIAMRTSYSEVYSFSTSPNLCQRTTMLNADVPNCYITL